MAAMRVLKVYLAIYGDCFRRALAAIGRNAWTLLLPVAVSVTIYYARILAAQAGIVGGLLMALASAALFSSYLYFVGELVQSGRVSLGELRNSIGAYFWSIINVFFVFWVATLVLSLLFAGNANGGALLLALWIVAVVALNATPEVIYLRGSYGGMQTIAASWAFLKAHWIPWFAVNVPLLAAVVLLREVVPPVPFLGPLLGDALAGAALHVVMVFRGNLFRALDGSSHRQRMFMQRVA
jgi:hypothetical protein